MFPVSARPDVRPVGRARSWLLRVSASRRREGEPVACHDRKPFFNEDSGNIRRELPAGPVLDPPCADRTGRRIVAGRTDGDCSRLSTEMPDQPLKQFGSDKVVRSIGSYPEVKARRQGAFILEGSAVTQRMNGKRHILDLSSARIQSRRKRFLHASGLSALFSGS
ncbi:hypothetical protein [Paraburkholderia graminis]|uniref:hypothetical protein n=1 Tax=Paraburkholderia graminis TaxID=60548 RepID=UPI001E406EFA|nr:hypothetical protein [Paraburkholderia graminis]